MKVKVTNAELVDGIIPNDKLLGTTKLMAEGCSELTHLTFPAGSVVKSAHLGNCPNLLTIGNIPTTLKDLNLSNCTFETLPHLPDGLDFLSLKDSKIKHIDPDALPLSLTQLDLTGCNSLECTDTLISKIMKIAKCNENNESFNILLPDHFNERILSLGLVESPEQEKSESTGKAARTEPAVTSERSLKRIPAHLIPPPINTRLDGFAR
jgi:hypothetical protein